MSKTRLDVAPPLFKEMSLEQIREPLDQTIVAASLKKRRQTDGFYKSTEAINAK